MGDDVRVVRGVLGVGLGLTGSSEPIDFVRDRGVRDLDAIPLVVGSGDFPLARAFASAGDIDRGMPPRPVRVDSPTIGEPERPLRIAMGPAERLVAPQQASLSRKFRATTESNLATAKFDCYSFACSLLRTDSLLRRALFTGARTPCETAPTMIRYAVISLAMFAVAAVVAEPAVARARPSEPAVVGVRGNEETTFSSVGSSRVRIEEEPLGLVPCDAPPAPPGCFILRTPFPPKGVRGAEACELKWPGLTVLLDDVELPILDSHFDGADVTFDVDIRAALKYAGVKAGDSRALRAIATLRCPTDTFEDAAEELPDNRVLRVGDADGRLIFPFNFFLLEEITYLADSIETLVEAADNLEITVDGTDGSEEFLYGGSGGGGGPHAFELDPRDEDTDGAGPAFTDDPEPAERPEFDLPEFDPPTFPWGEGLTA